MPPPPKRQDLGWDGMTCIQPMLKLEKSTLRSCERGDRTWLGTGAGKLYATVESAVVVGFCSPCFST